MCLALIFDRDLLYVDHAVVLSEFCAFVVPQGQVKGAVRRVPPEGPQKVVGAHHSKRAPKVDDVHGYNYVTVGATEPFPASRVPLERDPHRDSDRAERGAQ